MPELPEVETIVNMLAPRIVGKTICDCTVYLSRMLKNCQPEDFIKAVLDKKIAALYRRGKFIVLELSEGLVVVHLRMTGRLITRQHDGEPDKYRRLEWQLDDGAYLTYADTRTLGTIHYFSSQASIDIACLRNMGPEPLGSSWDAAQFAHFLQHSRRNIKAVLLDQSTVAGLGNIYVDETLHASKISPERRANDLADNEVSALYQAIIDILLKAIVNCGTSCRDYVDGEGNRGHNQDALQVYGRKNAQCYRCGGAIKYAKIAGRGTHWCEQCQI